MKRVAALAAVLLAVVPAGCGSRAKQKPAGTARSGSGSTLGGSGGAGLPTTTASTPTAPGPPTKTVHLSGFRSPTHNIGCLIFGELARCDIVKRTWSPPARPASCPSQVDFGQGLEVGSSGRGRLVCAGDTALDPTAAALPYGEDSRVRPFTCASRTIGVTCTNTRTRHGFFISRDSYVVF